MSSQPRTLKRKKRLNGQQAFNFIDVTQQYFMTSDCLQTPGINNNPSQMRPKVSPTLEFHPHTSNADVEPRENKRRKFEEITETQEKSRSSSHQVFAKQGPCLRCQKSQLWCFREGSAKECKECQAKNVRCLQTVDELKEHISSLRQAHQDLSYKTQYLTNLLKNQREEREFHPNSLPTPTFGISLPEINFPSSNFKPFTSPISSSQSHSHKLPSLLLSSSPSNQNTSTITSLPSSSSPSNSTRLASSLWTLQPESKSKRLVLSQFNQLFAGLLGVNQQQKNSMEVPIFLDDLFDPKTNSLCSSSGLQYAAQIIPTFDERALLLVVNL